MPFENSLVVIALKEIKLLKWLISLLNRLAGQIGLPKYSRAGSKRNYLLCRNQ
jgi:hypothetical protein